MLRAFALLVGLAALAGCAGVAPAPTPAPPADRCAPEVRGYRAWLDLAYAAQHVRQKLDLYVPDGAGPFPVLVEIHGGGWVKGDKHPARGLRQLRRGYAVASVNYRLSQHAPFPAQIQDVEAAIRWLRANAAAYRLDVAHFGVEGSSAGGHLSALVGTAGDAPALAGNQTPGPSGRVQAVVDHYGPTSLLDMDEQARRQGCPRDALCHDCPRSPEAQLIGCAIQTCPDRARPADPIPYATPDDPPFFIVHGKQDCTVPYGQSEALHAALVRAGIPSSLTLVDGAGHGGAAESSPQLDAAIDAFLDQHLRACPHGSSR